MSTGPIPQPFRSHAGLSTPASPTRPLHSRPRRLGKGVSSRGHQTPIDWLDRLRHPAGLAGGSQGALPVVVVVVVAQDGGRDADAHVFSRHGSRPPEPAIDPSDVTWYASALPRPRRRPSSRPRATPKLSSRWQPFHSPTPSSVPARPVPPTASAGARPWPVVVPPGPPAWHGRPAQPHHGPAAAPIGVVARSEALATVPRGRQSGPAAAAGDRERAGLVAWL